MTDVLGGRYRIVRLLGQGGMSDVYEAVDQRNDSAVAVKVVRATDPDLARRLAQEVRALARVEHRGLVRLLDTGLTDGRAYLVMELVDGTTLAEALRRGPLGPGRAATLGSELAGALAYVHGQGIVHRDVKPSNILLSADGGARLGDFGIARLLDASTLTIAGTTLGTAAYMAPEQLEDHQVGVSADVWSLGMVLLECLTGRRVYEGSPGEVVARRLAGPVPFPADLPVPWRLILSGMLDHRPDQRLDGSQVAALLATSPFRASWEPSPGSAKDPRSQAASPDLTALIPGAAATSLLVPDDTRIASSAPFVPSRRTGRRGVMALGGVAAAAAALTVGLLLAFPSNPASPRHIGASTTTRPSTTTSTSSTTTSTVATGSTVLAALTGDINTGVSAGDITPETGLSISTPAEQAVTDEAAGMTDIATNDLQQAARAVTNGVRNGTIAQSEGDTLQADLSTLAGALSLSVADTSPTTQPGPGPGPGPGKGKGKGKGG